MSDNLYLIIAMVIYMGAMLFIGWYSYRKTHNLNDYMLGGRELSPAVAALSAGAADMSGWLLMGLPGAIYAAGLVEAWIAVGLTVGAWLNWKFVAPRLRAYTQVANDSITVPSFLENRLRDGSRALRIASGLIILVFFTFYVSSGMVAGGVFFESSLGTGYRTGMMIVAAVTVATGEWAYQRVGSTRATVSSVPLRVTRAPAFAPRTSAVSSGSAICVSVRSVVAPVSALPLPA